VDVALLDKNIAPGIFVASSPSTSCSVDVTPLDVTEFFAVVTCLWTFPGSSPGDECSVDVAFVSSSNAVVLSASASSFVVMGLSWAVTASEIVDRNVM
jgi:hypothetical protein